MSRTIEYTAEILVDDSIVGFYYYKGGIRGLVSNDNPIVIPVSSKNVPGTNSWENDMVNGILDDLNPPDKKSSEDFWSNVIAINY